jgi:hypothetical protein
MVLLTDLNAVWPEGQEFTPTKELVALLVKHNPGYWGAENSPCGKALTETGWESWSTRRPIQRRRDQAVLVPAVTHGPRCRPLGIDCVLARQHPAPLRPTR